jgi:prepilin-type N-terminal cleavage/methylation domain-containing protein
VSTGRPRGFTLLEVLVAVAVIATALVSLLALHGRNLRIVADDLRVSQATLLAQGLMARTLVADPFPDPTRSRGDFANDPDVHWTVEILRGPIRDLEDELREIRVHVWWEGGDANGLDLVTLVRRPAA